MVFSLFFLEVLRRIELNWFGLFSEKNPEQVSDLLFLLSVFVLHLAS